MTLSFPTPAPPRRRARRFLFSFLTLACAGLAVGTPARAQDRTGEIAALFDWVTPGMPGCAVAVARHGEVVFDRAYGLADLEREVPITPSTRFDAGSVVKQFVAAAVLLLAEEGRLALTDDIRTYLPELPDYGHTITVDHLLTHTSGIRDWTGLGPLTGREIDALTLTLRQRGLDFAPGEEWSYSNGGYVLLKEIVARVGEMPFSEFTRTRLFDPLGMSQTRYLDDTWDVLANRALAYERDEDGWQMDVLLGNERGGGGALFSTARDLLTWNEALTNARLGAFVTEKIQEPARLRNGRTLGYARGLFLDENRGGPVVWHSGGAAGYGTFLVRFPDQGLSVATMCNAGEAAEGGAYARRIFELYVPEAEAPAKADEPSDQGVAVAESILNARAGLYFNERTGQPLRLVVHEGALRVAGGPALVAVAEDRFRNPNGMLRVMSEDKFELHFAAPGALEMTSMEGETTRYRRAEAYAPGADELATFAGRYANDETNAFLEIAPGEAGLQVRLNDSPPYPFEPVDRDVFQLGQMFLRFQRDAAGDVKGLDYSNPVVRNVAFIRQSDCAERP